MQLYWEATFAIAQALIAEYPDRDPAEVGLEELAQLIEALPQFNDDSALATERILTDIQITWFEENFSP